MGKEEGKVVKIVKWVFVIIIQKIFSLFPIDKNKVFSISYYGKGYGDNGKYVCNALISLRSDVLIIWPIKSENKLGDAPENVRCVRYYSLPFFYHLATSAIWLSNSRMPSYFIKRKKQFYVQLWHGGMGLKRVEKDAERSLSRSYILGAKHDSKMADLFVSSGRWQTDIFRKAFWYKGEILECGLPRNKILYEDNAITKKKIYNYLAIEESINVILYAPTFRSDFSITSYCLDMGSVRETLELTTKQKWHVCVRLHPSLVGAGVKFPQIEGVTDVSDYPDVYELLSAVDILISDYSSLMFEAAFAEKAVIIFANDIENYIEDRNFYFDLKMLPIPIATCNEEVIQIIKTWNMEEYILGVKKFMSEFGEKRNPYAAEDVAKVIIQHM